MNYLIWNGKDSRDIKGLIICELPPISKPQMRVIETTIDGVDGSLFEEVGYSSYDKALVIGLTQNADIDQISQYFSGSGEVVFSNEPDKCYKANIINQTDYARLARFKTATVAFRVQPFKYATSDDYVQCVQAKQMQGNDLYITDSRLTNFRAENTGDTSVTCDIARMGKNLFSGFAKGKKLDASTGAESNDTTGATSDFIPVDYTVNSHYFLSGLSTTLRTFVGAYNKDKQFLGRSGANPLVSFSLDANSFAGGTAQGSGDIAYLRITSYENSADDDIDIIDSLNVQLEIGTQATEYVPHNFDTIQLTLEAGEKRTLTNEELSTFQTEDGINHIFVDSDAVIFTATYCSNKTQIINKGNTTARPILKIRGSGTIRVKVGETIFEYTFPRGENFIAVDSELQDAYVSVGLRNRQMLGDFPVLSAGQTTVTWEGHITYFSIEKISRWL